VRFTASRELRDKLERLTALTPGSDLASVIDAAVSEKLERLEARRFGKTNKPRKNLDDADTSSGVRGISAAVKRFVWKRDGGRCTFVARDGRRCPERHRLEFDHDEAYGLGGYVKHEVPLMSDSCAESITCTWRRRSTAKRKWNSIGARTIVFVSRPRPLSSVRTELSTRLNIGLPGNTLPERCCITE